MVSCCMVGWFCIYHIYNSYIKVPPSGVRGLHLLMVGHWIVILLCFVYACQPKTEQKKVIAKPIKNSKEQTALEEKKDTVQKQKIIENKFSANPQYKKLQMKSYKEGLAKTIAKMQAKNTVKIVCYGNSITNGYKVGSYGTVENPYPKVLQHLLQTHYKNTNIEVINEGHNGWKCNQALISLEQLVLDKKPDLVIIEFGINDAYSEFSADFFKLKMIEIATRIRQSQAEVLLLNPNPIRTPYEEKVLKYSPALKSIAEIQNCAFFNLHDALLARMEKEKIDLQDFLPDDVHLADDKYAWLAEAIFGFLIEL